MSGIRILFEAPFCRWLISGSVMSDEINRDAYKSEYTHCNRLGTGQLTDNLTGYKITLIKFCVSRVLYTYEIKVF